MAERKKDIGGIWKRDGRYGPYMSGQIEINGQKHNFRIYENSYKNSEKQPDYKIFPVDPPKPAVVPKWTPPITEEDIPF